MTRRRDEDLYTQFCIGVELGDDSLVRNLIQRGADTMVSYGVDGVITTPMHSALSKGDIPMTLALLTSRATRVKLADLDAAPKVKRELVTPVLIQRLSTSLEEGAREMLLERPSANPQSRRPVKISLTESLADHFRSDDLHASPTDKPRCPPPPPESENSEVEEEETEETEETEEDKSSSPRSIPSSAGESSDED